MWFGFLVFGLFLEGEEMSTFFHFKVIRQMMFSEPCSYKYLFLTVYSPQFIIQRFPGFND